MDPTENSLSDGSLSRSTASVASRANIVIDWDVVSLPYTPVCKYRGRAGPWRRESRRIVQVSEQHQRNDGTDRTFYYLLTPP